jgi:gliding motility-associated-like protein/uncharacterized repeat protein (TIGR01451 family)
MAQTKIAVLGVLLLHLQLVFCQTPFVCQGHSYLIHSQPSGAELWSISALTSSATPELNLLFDIPNRQNIDAIGFRVTDNFIYGIDQDKEELLRIGADGNVEAIAEVAGVPGLTASISPDGRYFTSITTDCSLMALIDLDATPATIEFRPLAAVDNTSAIYCSDIAYAPDANYLYGFDTIAQKMIFVNPENGIVDNVSSPVLPLEAEVPAAFSDFRNTFWGIYTDAPGNNASLLSYNFLTSELETLPLMQSFDGKLDACSCPFGLRLLKTVQPQDAQACMDVYYTFKLVNYTGLTLQNLNFTDALPPGLTFRRLVYNPFDVEAQINFGNQLSLSGFDITRQLDSLVIQMEVQKGVVGQFPNQARIDLSAEPNTPDFSDVLSDDPTTAAYQDPTVLRLSPPAAGTDRCADRQRQVYAPSAFSPNGDQINDVFFLQTANKLSLLEFEVYNRWGNNVYSRQNIFTNDPLTGWTGEDQEGNVLPGGLYAWMARIKFLDGNTFSFSGSILLGR